MWWVLSEYFVYTRYHIYMKNVTECVQYLVHATTRYLEDFAQGTYDEYHVPVTSLRHDLDCVPIYYYSTAVAAQQIRTCSRSVSVWDLE